MQQQFEDEGRIWLRNAISQSELANLDALADFGNKPGSRVAASQALFAAITNADWAAALSVNWPGMRPVRVVSFDKSQHVNWGVPWHQDRIISVREKHPVPGFSAWSQKGGVWHCEPPLNVLEAMLFVRVHLDDNNSDNGAMEIALGSHRIGMCPSDAAANQASKFPHEICDAKRGDILVLKMLTLHRSLPSVTNQQRRVLRIDFACDPLPKPLEWE